MDKGKRGQSEIAGFVLIVVIVVVVLMVFLIISAKKPSQAIKSQDSEDMLSAVLGYTSGCAIVFEPQYSTIQKLMGDCYNNRRCSNVNRMACDYLNESLVKIMGSIMESEAQVSAWSLDVSYKTSTNNRTLITPLIMGNCSGQLRQASQPIATDNGNIVVSLNLCYG